jgi:hypothetical protein
MHFGHSTCIQPRPGCARALTRSRGLALGARGSVKASGSAGKQHSSFQRGKETLLAASLLAAETISLAIAADIQRGKFT